jgi:hypothetical protein
VARNHETGKVTVEVELADPRQEPDGPYETLIKVRIVGTERDACQMVKEAVLLAIERAFRNGEKNGSQDIPAPIRH